ncbi:riboflavin kinase [Candidatus Saccharibacteria bacterium]|nr:riboflavin kinase [Candidatus Saccharibacteria bacterium]
MSVVKLEGLVRRFDGNGRKLGYPTANINTATNLSDGVYFGFADLAKYRHHPALIFIGAPLTLGNSRRRVEAHLLDIDDVDYYDNNIQLEIHHFWRPNQKFESTGELIKAMQADEAAARQWFDKVL